MTLPDWAPNLHPLVVHFPIVLILTAVVADWLDIALQMPAWVKPMARSLYIAGGAGAALAYWTGTRAANTVFVPGMAHPFIEDHRTWALGATVLAAGLAVGQLAMRLAGGRWRRLRVTLAVGGLLAALLVQQTAERGGRLVYEHGVGVVAPPRSR